MSIDKFASMVEYDKGYEVIKRYFVPTSLPCCVISVSAHREGTLQGTRGPEGGNWPEWRYVSLQALEDHVHYADTWRWRLKQAWRNLRYGRQANPYLEFNTVEEIEALIAALLDARVEAFDKSVEAHEAV